MSKEDPKLFEKKEIEEYLPCSEEYEHFEEYFERKEEYFSKILAELEGFCEKTEKSWNEEDMEMLFDLLEYIENEIQARVSHNLLKSEEKNV